jgi:hypothetical protein
MKSLGKGKRGKCRGSVLCTNKVNAQSDEIPVKERKWKGKRIVKEKKGKDRKEGNGVKYW